MTPDEEAAYVREVAEQKTAALRMSLDAGLQLEGTPFVGEFGWGGAEPRAAPDRASGSERRPGSLRPGSDI